MVYEPLSFAVGEEKLPLVQRPIRCALRAASANIPTLSLTRTEAYALGIGDASRAQAWPGSFWRTNRQIETRHDI
jgi:hypothetical protein